MSQSHIFAVAFEAFKSYISFYDHKNSVVHGLFCRDMKYLHYVTLTCMHACSVQTNKQTDRQTDRQIDRQTNRPTDRQTDRQTD